MAGTALAALAAATTAAGVGAPSALAVSTLTVNTSFENTPVSLTTSDAVGFALANTSGSTQAVTFTDTLPAGVTLDSPIGTTNTAGGGACTNVAVTNPTSGQPSSAGDGAVTVSATVPSVAGSSSTKPVCTISLSVVASSASVADGTLHDSYSNLSPSPLLAATPGNVVALTNPTLNVIAPTNNRTFALGQLYDASFSCAATDPLDSIDSVFGTDDEGNQISSGEPIDTVDPGAHQLEIDCYSAVGGGDVSQTINYRVGSYSLSSVKASAGDKVSFRTTVPAGKLVAELIDGKKVIGTTKVTIHGRKNVGVSVKPTGAGAKLLLAAKGKRAAVKLQVAFTPSSLGSGDFQISPSTATVLTRNLKLAVA